MAHKTKLILLTSLAVVSIVITSSVSAEEVTNFSQCDDKIGTSVCAEGLKHCGVCTASITPQSVANAILQCNTCQWTCPNPSQSYCNGSCITKLTCPSGQNWNGCQCVAGAPSNYILNDTNQQAGANFNIEGSGTIFGNLSLTNANSGIGDIYMTSGKAIQINNTSPTTLSIGNWGGASYTGTVNVNIGTSVANNPGNLNVFGSLSTFGNIFGNRVDGTLGIYSNYSSSNGSTIEMYGNDSTALGGTRKGSLFLVAGNGDGTANGGDISFMDYNGSSWDTNVIVKKSGEVGIGTVSPNSNVKLDVYGSINTLSDSSNIAYKIGTYGVLGYKTDYKRVVLGGVESGSLIERVDLFTSGNPRMTINAAGKVTINNGLQILATGVAGKVLTANDVGDASWQPITGVLPPGTSGQTLRYNGTAWVSNSVIYNDGTNVGIGTSNLAAGVKLDVAGGVKIGASGGSELAGTISYSGTPGDFYGFTGDGWKSLTSSASDGSAMTNRGAVTETNIDTAIGNGYYTINKTGYSSGLLSFNAGGSNGPFQLDANYYGLLRWRNKTDSNTWTAWKAILSNGGTNLTANYIPKLVDATGQSLGNSQIFSNNTGVGIGTNDPGFPLHVVDNDGMATISIDNNGSKLWTGTRLADDGAEKWFLGWSGAAASTTYDLIIRRNSQNNDIVINNITGVVSFDNQVQIKGGNPGVNKVLTSDGTGLASWVAPAVVTEVDGVIGNEVTDATGGTLTRSGSGTTASPYKLALNLGNANIWTASQTFNASPAIKNTTGNFYLDSNDSVQIHISADADTGTDTFGINSGLGNGTRVFEVDRTGTLTQGTIPWTKLTYPAACSPGSFVTTIGSTVTCATPSGLLPIGTSGQTLRHDGTGWVANSAITNDGTKIGIGNTNPMSPLSIKGAAPGCSPSGSCDWKGQLLIEPTVDNADGAITLKTTYTATDRLWSIVAGNGQVTNTNFRIFDSTANLERLAIDSNGNVGIGTGDAGPVVKLDVKGQVMFGSATEALMDSNKNLIYGNVLSGAAGSGLLLLQYAGADKFKVDKDGNVIIAPLAGGTNRCVQSDSAGKLVNAACGSGTIGGSGMQNYIPKFNNAAGTSIGNSQIIDDGTNVSIGTTGGSYTYTFLDGLRISGEDPLNTIYADNKDIIITTGGINHKIVLSGTGDWTKGLVVDTTNGYAGIGTVSPGTPLEINLNRDANYGMMLKLVQAGASAYDGPKVLFKKNMPSGTKSWNVGILQGPTNNNFAISEGGGENTDYGIPRLTIAPSGNVTLSSLVGTGTQCVQADVNGVLSKTACATGNMTNPMTAIGDLIYGGTAGANSTPTRLADVATGNVLISGGVGVAPSWGKIVLGGNPNHVSGTLAVGNGGTGTSNGSITGTGALTFAAGAGNNNITLTPSGTGYTVLNGNVGIGIATPAAKLHIKGSANNPQLIIDAYSGQTNSMPLIRLRNSAGSAMADISADDKYNIFFGFSAGGSITSGTNNSFFGYNAGAVTNSGTNNVALGYNALSDNTIGSYNVAIGRGPLSLNINGNQNVALGYVALLNLSSGSGNTAVGSSAGAYLAGGVQNLNTANNSVYIGNGSRGLEGDTNAIVIGTAAESKGNNKIVLGNSNITDTYITAGNLTLYNGNINLTGTGCYQDAGVTVAGTGCTSDIHLKKNINELPNNTLNKLLLLKPSTFAFKDVRYGSTSTNNYGLIAQEVEKAFPEWVSIGKDGYKAVDYGLNIQMSMLKGIQEIWGNFQMLFAWNSDQDQQIKELQSQVAELKAQLNSAK